jgi:NTE family protein
MSTHSAGITLVLGGGGARGLAHAGVLAGLEEAGVPIKAVVGTSIGAEIGAFYASGIPPARIEAMAEELDWLATVRLFWPNFDGGGLTSGENIEAYLRERLGEATFADCHPPLRAIATDMERGREVILDSGELVAAVRASIALPGLIAPYRLDSRWLGDGGLVNPLPVDVARRTFGGPVLAVAVHPGAMSLEDGEREEPEPFGTREEHPGLTDNLRRAIQITQAQLVYWHLREDPPDSKLTPIVPGMTTLEFYRGGEAAAAGRRAVADRAEELRHLALTASG